MSEHTPGPWMQSGAYISGGESVHVATLNAQLGIEEAQANARLIAAAPELLGACKQFIANLEDAPVRKSEWPDLIRTKHLALAAIARATGREP